MDRKHEVLQGQGARALPGAVRALPTVASVVADSADATPGAQISTSVSSWTPVWQDILKEQAGTLVRVGGALVALAMVLFVALAIVLVVTFAGVPHAAVGSVQHGVVVSVEFAADLHPVLQLALALIPVVSAVLAAVRRATRPRPLRRHA